MNYAKNVINDGREINVVAGMECDIDLRVFPKFYRFRFSWIEQEIRLFFFGDKPRFILKNRDFGKYETHAFSPLKFFELTSELNGYEVIVHADKSINLTMKFSNIEFNNGLVGFTLTS